MFYLQSIKIEFDDLSGIQNGFFCFKCVINGEAFYPQFCIDGTGPVDFNDCGYDWGICADVNKTVADRISWHCLLLLLEVAWLLYNNNEVNNENS